MPIIEAYENIVGAHDDTVHAAITTDAIHVGKVCLFNVDEISANMPWADLFATPAAFAAGWDDHVTDVNESGGIDAKVALFPDAVMAILEAETIPTSHFRDMEDAWKTEYGDVVGVAKLSDAIRRTFIADFKKIDEEFLSQHGTYVEHGNYGGMSMIPNAWIHPEFYDPELYDIQEWMFGPGGAYQWQARELQSVNPSMYVPNAFFTTGNCTTWAENQVPLLGKNIRQAQSFRHPYWGRARRRSVQTIYLGMHYASGPLVVVPQNLVEAIIEGIDAQREETRIVIWASAADALVATNLANQMQNVWVPAIDALDL